MDFPKTVLIILVEIFWLISKFMREESCEILNTERHLESHSPHL